MPNLFEQAYVVDDAFNEAAITRNNMEIAKGQEEITKQRQIETRNQLREEKKAKHIEALKNTLYPLSAFSQDMPWVKDAKGESLPNFTKSQMTLVTKFFQNMKDPETGQPVIQDVGGEPSIPDWAVDYGMTLLEKDTERKGKAFKAMATAKINDKRTEAFGYSEEIKKYHEKNPLISDQPTTKNELGQTVENPNFDPKYKQLIDKQTAAWREAQDWQKAMQEPKQDTARTAEEAAIYGTPEEQERAFKWKEHVAKTGETATDPSRYVAFMTAEWERTHSGMKPTPGQQGEWLIEAKRAQADEVRSNTLAKRGAEAATAERIKYNEGIGKGLAEIATAGQIEAEKIKGKGEVTPVAKMAEAKGRFTNNLASLGNHYLTLDSMGAIVNVNNGSIENLAAAASSSTVGQYMGQRLGTDAQSIRESIKKLKPLLIQDIRQSTNMSARGLDSEKELEFYMRAATDEKTDIQSNIAALIVLDEAYGDGDVADQLRSLTDEKSIRSVRKQGNEILKGKLKTRVTTQDQFETGKVYKDAQGNKAKYLGGGQWQAQ